MEIAKLKCENYFKAQVWKVINKNIKQYNQDMKVVNYVIL